MNETAPEIRMFALTFYGIMAARLCYIAAKLRLADLIGDAARAHRRR